MHNLKNVSIKIPKNKLIVFTGISGSGKSSLAFDTIYAEGQRRYVESMSNYAKQFLGVMDKPDVDQINGLSPAISIDQRSTTSNPRSTVGTVTEIYDYLRLLYARIGRVHCPKCQNEIFQETPAQIVNALLKMGGTSGKKIKIFSPLVEHENADYFKTLSELSKAGYHSVRVNGMLINLSELGSLRRDKEKTYTVELLIREIDLGDSKNSLWVRHEAEKAVNEALDFGNGQIIIHDELHKKDIFFSQYYHCLKCNIRLPSIEPRNFSFNSPAGACQKCSGLGTCLEVDPELVIPNKRLTLAQGAIKPWARNFSNQHWYWQILHAVSKDKKFSLDIPVSDLSPQALKIIFYGTGDKEYALENGESKIFEGVVNILGAKYLETSSDYLRQEIVQYMRISICPECIGKRLKPESLSVTVLNKNIYELSSMNILESREFFREFLKKKNGKDVFSAKEKKISESIAKEVLTRLSFLIEVGLSYLALDRSAESLSGGEAQRIRLATQLGLNLSGVVYILDEPSIGLHQKDNQQLIATLQRLRDIGNTVIVVEHDEQTMMAADEIVDIGPGAGEYGGKIVSQGKPLEIMKDASSLTGQYLSGRKIITPPKNYRKGSGKYIEIIGASEFNLKNVNVKIPLGVFVCLTGVSGSGKSTLMLDILVRALLKKFYHAKDNPGKHKEIRGIEHIDKVISIDQSPIGRTPRSNPATYTGVFTYIRDLFSQIPEAKIRRYDVGKFSFNAKGGRCENCSGEGVVKIEMQFLPDVYIQCEECRGERYQKEVLEIHYMGKNISDVLNMSVEEAMKFFSRQPIIYDKLKTLYDVGLGYIKLGQSAITLSGGEAQRVKLATELSRRATGKTLYILDEPTTGLHFEDIKHLLGVLNHLVEKGNTVLIIEHNLDVIKSSDWVIDMGPEGGDRGGEIIAEGTPKEIVKVSRSYTGRYLKKIL